MVVNVTKNFQNVKNKLIDYGKKILQNKKKFFIIITRKYFNRGSFASL